MGAGAALSMSHNVLAVFAILAALEYVMARIGYHSRREWAERHLKF